MKTIIFVVLIIASASYLAIGEKSPLSVSADGSTVSVDIEKVSSDVSKQLNEQFAQQLSSFKNEMVQNQQRQIEALQQSVVNLAQKSAQLERKLNQQSDQQSAQQLARKPQVEQQQVVYAEPQITQSHSADNQGPDVGAISKPVNYDGMGGETSNSANDVLAQVNEVADGANHGFAEGSMPNFAEGSAEDSLSGSTDMAMMDKQQRRKRLQNLSERMTLKSLGIEK